jgi:hypothetical protein
MCREKALSERFCLDFDNCLRHLYEFCKLREPITTTPEFAAHRIFDKLKYDNWRSSTIETYYLQPLWNAFYLMSSNLGKLFAQGKGIEFKPMSL